MTPSGVSDPRPANSGRALVLHGGGSLGHAWEIGVVAGLLDAGVDVTAADLIIGTSAGSTAAVQIAAARPSDLLTTILSTPQPSSRPGQIGLGSGPAGAMPVIDHLERTNRIIAVSVDATDMRKKIGAAALELQAASDGSWSARWRGIVGARLSGQEWPEQRILITAVDAQTGEPVVFDRHSGVELVDAIAASTSSGMPYRIGDRHYIDGGYRRNENADLAAGHRQVLVLSPFGGRSRHPREWGMQLSAQIEELRVGGSTVEAILPNDKALTVFGNNMMDLSQRPPAARAGYDHGRALGAGLMEFWH